MENKLLDVPILKHFRVFYTEDTVDKYYFVVPYLFGYKTGVSPLQNDYK